MTALHETRELHSADGTRLVMQTWTPPEARPRATVLVVHGYADHAGRYRELAHCFADAGLTTAAVDLRGHGLSAGRRGYTDRFEAYLDDVAAALASLTARPVFALAHSFGALVTLDFVTRRPEAGALAGLVLSNPFLALAMEAPPWKLWLSRKLGALLPALALPSGVPAEFMSRDASIVDAYRRDPLVFRIATAGWFAATEAAQQRVQSLTRLPHPLLYIYSDSDPLGDPRANEALARTLESPDKTVWVRRGELHEVLNELDRTSLHGQIRDWLLARLERTTRAEAGRQ